MPRLASFTLLAALIALAGCGSSDKPAYCSQRSDLQQSVKGLGDVNLSSGGLSALQAQLTKVATDAEALVASAKSSFPSQTSALKSSVSALDSAVRQLPSSPSVQQVAALVPAVQGVATAAKSLAEATTSKC